MITTQTQADQLATAINSTLNANLKIQEELKRELGNTSLNKATGATWGDSFASLPLTDQLRRVWSNVSETRHIKGERADGTLYDFIVNAWDKHELAKLAQLGKASAMLKEYEDKQELESLSDYLMLDGVDCTDF